jgi:exopolyphosphatase / guanosine-5'-triphosphate,3'-diphosphate pyrophosphatase
MTLTTSKIAVCDLGTNIWRLRIVEIPPNINAKNEPTAFLQLALKDSVSLRESVFMAREGGDTMSAATLLRCKTALQNFKNEMDKHALAHTWIAATAGFRKAANAPELVAWAQTELGFVIETISGDDEAALLGAGIRAAMQPHFVADERALLVDVGGGSVEYIISDADQTFWAKSYPIGVSALYEKFVQKATKTDKTQPFSASETDNILSFLNEILKEIPALLQQYQVAQLAMTAGTFSVLHALLGIRRSDKMPFDILKTSDFERLCAELMPQTQTELYANPRIPAHRVELLQISLLLIVQAVTMTQVAEIVTPHWSMEEGMLLMTAACTRSGE